jgi:hypothetical protein
MGLGDSNMATTDTNTRGMGMWYAFVVVTLLLALEQLWFTLRGAPPSTFSRGFLVALACMSLGGFVKSPATRRAFMILAIIILLGSAYTLIR